MTTKRTEAFNDSNILQTQDPSRTRLVESLAQLVVRQHRRSSIQAGSDAEMIADKDHGKRVLSLERRAMQPE
jgi:hypothetical protein